MLTDFINTISSFLYTYCLVFVLIACGIYFSIRTRFVQVRFFKDIAKLLVEKGSQQHISPFGALMISTASRVGIGNIVGVSVAISMGGAGALFWMWMAAFFGGASAFVESTLAQVYKEKDAQGGLLLGFRGGPAYYIKTALNSRAGGIVFAISLLLCFALGFNGLQSYTLTSVFEHYVGSESFENGSFKVIIGLVLALLSACFFFGKSKSTELVSSVLVPLMALGYFAVAAVVIAMNFSALPDVFLRVFQSAFDFESIFGGFAGSAIVIGIKRGLYSNEAGMGSAPNAAASAITSHPAKQGMVQTLSVFIDTFVICSASAFLILCSNEKLDGLRGMAIMQAVMNGHLGEAGIHFISVAIILFAFTSIIGNFFYAQMNFKFITDSALGLNVFRALSVFIVFLGAQIDFGIAWDLADVFMGLMALVNIAAILFLGNIAIAVLKDYESQKRAGKNPEFKASNVGVKNAECW